jgi:hypothetical protein
LSIVQVYQPRPAKTGASGLPAATVSSYEVNEIQAK